MIRLVILFLLACAIYSFLLGKYEECDYSCKTIKCKTVVVFLVTSAILLFVLSWVREQNPVSGYNYWDLARAFMEGHVWCAENTDSVLANMENPYSYVERAELGAAYLWDTTYYEGYYYIYFGVTPVILFFLPYYLLTGKDLSYFQAEAIILVIIVMCGFVLVNQLRKRIFPQAPWKITMLLSVILASLSGVILFLKRTQIYYTAIATALMLVMIGLILWLHARKCIDSNESKRAIIVGMLGSLSMALAVGARPQFAMASFLAFAIFANLFRKIKQQWWILALLIAPYIPVASFLMWYNYARFGSMFDFGANYNLTGYDMTHMGIHFSRIPTGIWYYLFNLPRLNIDFPYLIAQGVVSSYPGYMVSELQIGGAIAIMPICLILAKLYRKSFRDSVRIVDKDFIKFIYICLISVVIIVIGDTVMCGILTRYQMDYRIYLLLATFVVAFLILRIKYQTGTDIVKSYKIISTLGLVTLCFGVLTIIAQYEAPDYANPLVSASSVYLQLERWFGGFIY